MGIAYCWLLAASGVARHRRGNCKCSTPRCQRIRGRQASQACLSLPRHQHLLGVARRLMLVKPTRRAYARSKVPEDQVDEAAHALGGLAGGEGSREVAGRSMRARSAAEYSETKVAAAGKRVIPESEYMGVLVTEMNYHVRPGSAVWLGWKYGAGKPVSWPMQLTQLRAPESRDTIIEVGGYWYYNTLYLSQGRDPFSLLQPHMIGNNVWVLANEPVNRPSSTIASCVIGHPATTRDDELISLVDGRTQLASTDVNADDPNGLPSETIIVLGWAEIARAATKGARKGDLVKLGVLPAGAGCDSVEALLPAGASLKGCAHIATRCPWAKAHPVPPIAMERTLLPCGFAYAEYDPELGLFTAWQLASGRVVRLLGSPSGGVVAVSECPPFRTLHTLFPASPVITELSATPRVERAWGRTVGELVIKAPHVRPDAALQLASFEGATEMVIATPPYVPPLLTLVETASVAVHALALTDASGSLQPVAETPISTVLRGLEQHIVRKGGLVTHQAKISMRRALLVKARSLKWDTETDVLEAEIEDFGLRKLLSTDFGPVMDVTSPADGVIGFEWERPDDCDDLSAYAESFGFTGLAVVRRTRGGELLTKYFTFAYSPAGCSEASYNLATERLVLRMYVRWWNRGLVSHSGVPLRPPEGREEAVYSCIDGQWYDAASAAPTVTAARAAQRFPTAFDAKLR